MRLRKPVEKRKPFKDGDKVWGVPTRKFAEGLYGNRIYMPESVSKGKVVATQHDAISIEGQSGEYFSVHPTRCFKTQREAKLCLAKEFERFKDDVNELIDHVSGVCDMWREPKQHARAKTKCWLLKWSDGSRLLSTTMADVIDKVATCFERPVVISGTFVPNKLPRRRK